MLCDSLKSHLKQFNLKIVVIPFTNLYFITELYTIENNCQEEIDNVWNCIFKFNVPSVNLQVEHNSHPCSMCD